MRYGGMLQTEAGSDAVTAVDVAAVDEATGADGSEAIAVAAEAPRRAQPIIAC